MQTLARELRITLITFAAVVAATPLLAQGTIDTDRPGFLFATTTVPEGMLQVELGLPLVTLDEPSGGPDVRLLQFPAALRYGWSDSLELRLGAPVYNRLRVESGGTTSHESGVGDVEVGLKWALPQGFADAAALIAGVRLPTGEDPFSVDDPAPSLNAVASWTVFEDMTFKGLVGWSHTPVHAGADVDAGALGALLGRSLAEDLSGYVEAAFFPSDDVPDTSYAGFGLGYLLSDDAQVDLSLDAGLDEDAADWIFGVGYSRRF